MLDKIIQDYGSVQAHYEAVGRDEGIQPYFATGGAFTNGIVSRPTEFSMGLMGEAGPEAIMPLANVGGSLGVRVSNEGNAELVQRVDRLTMTVERLVSLVGEIGGTAAQQRAQQIREQQKTNRNTKQKVALT